MTIKQYIELLAYIDKNHSFRNLMGKHIKYIEHIWDFRTNKIFCVKLRPIYEDEIIFTTVNENKNRDLKQWIYDYLDN